MATERLRVILEAITDKFRTAMGQASTATGQLAGAVRGLNTGTGTLNGSFGQLSSVVKGVLALGLTRYLADAGRAAEEDAKSQQILRDALTTNTGATRDQIDANDAWITSMQSATNVADTDLRQAVTNLVVSGRSLEEAQKDVAIAADIAATKGIALGSVVTGLTRAINSGSVAGLARLGIATKDASGEMLSYQQILDRAGDTMGGTAARAATLTGRLEQQRIRLQELKEQIGATFLPTQVLIGDWFNELIANISGGNEALAGAQTRFDLLVSQGIDPFINKSASLITALQGVTTAASPLEGTLLSKFLPTSLFDDLSTATGLTEDYRAAIEHFVTVLQPSATELAQAASFLQEQGEAAGFTAEQIGILSELLAEQSGVIDGAVGAHQRWQRANDKTKRSTEELTEAVAAQHAAIREASDPVFRFVGALGRYESAQQRLNDLQREGQQNTSDYRDAISDLLDAQLDLNGAQQELAASGDLDVLRGIAEQAGINADVFDRWADSIGSVAGAIAGLPSSITVVGGPKTVASGSGGNLAFQHGGVVPGPVGAPQLAVVHGGETVLPTHHGGMRQQIASQLRISGEPALEGVAAMMEGRTSWAGRARGGPVTEGQPYIVGEQGAEMFVPRQAGTIIPAGSWGGRSVTVNQTIVRPETSSLDRDLAYGALLAGLMSQVGA